MRFFEQKLSLVVLLLTLPLLFLPKINLISVDSGETAGLRIDDLVLFFLGAFLMWAHFLSKNRLYKIEGWMLLITLFSIFSFLANRLLFSLNLLYAEAKIYYTVRLLEYFLFFYLGALASRHFNVNTLTRTFFIWNISLMILQKLNLAGGIATGGYQADVSGRVQGIASFPSEMGLLLNILFCYMIFNDSSESRFVNFFPSPHFRYLLRKLYPYAMFCLFGLFIILTGNRISILALIISFLFRLRKEFSLHSASSWIVLLILIPLVVTAIGTIILKTSGVYDRSLGLFSFKNIELFELVWNKIDIIHPPAGDEATLASQYDMSWWIRIHKWLFVTKSFLLSPQCYLQGLGPGFCGAALDGGILRILTEYGLIGAFLFYNFFASLYRINAQTKWMMIAFSINMIFFDAYLAYKTMSILFFLSGALFQRQKAMENGAFYKILATKS